MPQEITDTESLSSFTRDPRRFIEKLRQSGEPILLTVEGEGEVVVQDAESYRRFWEQIDRQETIAAVREGLRDVAAGRTRPVREVLAELARKYKLPPAQSE